MSDATTITIRQDTRKRLREIAEELSAEEGEFVSMDRLLHMLIAVWERSRSEKHK